MRASSTSIPTASATVSIEGDWPLCASSWRSVTSSFRSRSPMWTGRRTTRDLSASARAIDCWIQSVA
jgi:hypothetical protein